MRASDTKQRIVVTHSVINNQTPEAFFQNLTIGTLNCQASKQTSLAEDSIMKSLQHLELNDASRGDSLLKGSLDSC